MHTDMTAQAALRAAGRRFEDGVGIDNCQATMPGYPGTPPRPGLPDELEELEWPGDDLRWRDPVEDSFDPE